MVNFKYYYDFTTPFWVKKPLFKGQFGSEFITSSSFNKVFYKYFLIIAI